MEGFDFNTQLVNVYLHENLIKKIENISHLSNLKVINLENNQIEKIKGLEGCLQLQSINLAKNRLSKPEDIEQLNLLPELTQVDLNKNKFVKYWGEGFWELGNSF